MDDETQTPGQQVPADADTTSDQTSAADVQVNNEAPEAPQEVKDSVSQATDTVEEKLYAGKYKTPEDMEKAYTELQSKATRDSQEKAELNRILNEAFTAPEPAQGQTDDFAEPDPLAEKVDRIERQGAVQNFIFAHPDADAANMNNVLTQDPVIKQIQGHDAKLEYAYFKSKNMTTTQAIAEARQSAATATQAKIVEKQAAQVESARKADQTDGSADLYNKATGNYGKEDRDKARMALIRKNLVNL